MSEEGKLDSIIELVYLNTSNFNYFPDLGRQVSLFSTLLHCLPYSKRCKLQD